MTAPWRRFIRPIWPESLVRFWRSWSILRSIRSTCWRRLRICRDKADVKLLLFGGMRNFGCLQAAQFVRIGELIETFEAEKLEEKRRRLVEQGTARLFGATRDADDFALEQRGHDAIDRHA